MWSAPYDRSATSFACDHDIAVLPKLFQKTGHEIIASLPYVYNAFMKDLGQAAANSATALGEEVRDGGTRSQPLRYSCLGETDS